jgi:hypothetical protein
MSVQLGTIQSLSAGVPIEVWADQYDSDEIRLCINESGLEIELTFDRKQIQELTKILDRFMDR